MAVVCGNTSDRNGDMNEIDGFSVLLALHEFNRRRRSHDF